MPPCARSTAASKSTISRSSVSSAIFSPPNREIRMINKLVLENLRHRWIRTLLSALVIGVQVMSILTLIGLSQGLLEESAARQKGTGADIFLKPDNGGATI